MLFAVIRCCLLLFAVVVVHMLRNDSKTQMLLVVTKNDQQLFRLNVKSKRQCIYIYIYMQSTLTND